MKCAVVIASGMRQVMLTGETPEEVSALRMIGEPGQDLSVEFKTGHFYDDSPSSARGYTVSECKGGYLRAYDSRESLMVVLRPADK